MQDEYPEELLAREAADGNVSLPVLIKLVQAAINNRCVIHIDADTIKVFCQNPCHSDESWDNGPKTYRLDFRDHMHYVTLHGMLHVTREIIGGEK